MRALLASIAAVPLKDRVREALLPLLRGRDRREYRLGPAGRASAVEGPLFGDPKAAEHGRAVAQ
jgi:hypothetical protein